MYGGKHDSNPLAVAVTCQTLARADNPDLSAQDRIGAGTNHNPGTATAKGNHSSSKAMVQVEGEDHLSSSLTTNTSLSSNLAFPTAQDLDQLTDPTPRDHMARQTSSHWEDQEFPPFSCSSEV